MDFLNLIPSWSLFVIAGIIGAILGSFANVCIYRMPRDESVIWPASHCPHCGYRIKPWENIPLLSYIFLRGHCRGCNRHISFAYPAIEVVSILFSLFTWWYFASPVAYLVFFCLLIMPLLIASVIDLKHYILPDSITLPGIVIGIAVHTLLEGQGDGLAHLMDSGLGIVVGGGTLYLVATAYEKIKKQEGLGGGDVKLVAMLGAFFGWRAVILILLMSSLLGSVVGLFLIVALRKNMKYAIPFGPFLAASGITYLFVGERLIDWYLGLFF
jgi:leader peptidase (prepilin peptidase)/N-methyltransferase